MNKNAFSYELTMSELKYLLLSRKECPSCGGILKRNKRFSVVKGSTLTDESQMFFRQNANVKKYEFYYCCEKCRREYSLSELSN